MSRKQDKTNGCISLLKIKNTRGGSYALGNGRKGNKTRRAQVVLLVKIKIGTKWKNRVESYEIHRMKGERDEGRKSEWLVY